MLPILVEHVKTVISSAVQAAGTTLDSISPEAFAQFNIYIKGVEILGNGAFLSSLLIAGWLACVIDKNYKNGALFASALGICSLIGLIHSSQMFLLNKEVIILSVGYFAIAAITYQRFLENRSIQQEVDTNYEKESVTI